MVLEKVIETEKPSLDTGSVAPVTTDLETAVTSAANTTSAGESTDENDDSEIVKKDENEVRHRRGPAAHEQEKEHDEHASNFATHVLRFSTN